MDSQTTTWLLYGAYGYTGNLIAREAVQRGWQPILAGRNEKKLRQMAEELQLDFRAFSLDQQDSIAKSLHGCAAVLHCAGPFSQTARPMMEGCLAAGVHYLDITGEIDVIEMAAAFHERAKNANVVLLPAVGFDVVPTDCLAAMLAEKMPEATRLALAINALGEISPGTAKTLVELLPAGGRVRDNGRIVRVPLGHKVRSIPFADRRRQAMTFPWGDVASAYHSTGIKNIEVYMALPKSQLRRIRRLRWLVPLLGSRPFRPFWKWLIKQTQGGPTQEEREGERAQIWGEVSREDGASLTATLTTPSGYALTVEAALAAVEGLTGGGGSVDQPDARTAMNGSEDQFRNAGFHTPSTAFGGDFIRQFDVTLSFANGD